ALIAGAVGVIVHAIDEKVVERAALSVDVVAGVAAGDAAIFEYRFAHPGREQREIGVRAAVQRQGDDRRVGDYVAAAAGVGLDRGCGADYFYRLGDGAHLQLKIDALVRVDGDGEFFRDRGFESVGLGLEFVASDFDIEERVAAVRIGVGY